MFELLIINIKLESTTIGWGPTTRTSKWEYLLRKHNHRLSATELHMGHFLLPCSRMGRIRCIFGALKASLWVGSTALRQCQSEEEADRKETTSLCSVAIPQLQHLMHFLLIQIKKRISYLQYWQNSKKKGAFVLHVVCDVIICFIFFNFFVYFLFEFLNILCWKFEIHKKVGLWNYFKKHADDNSQSHCGR